MLFCQFGQQSAHYTLYLEKMVKTKTMPRTTLMQPTQSQTDDLKSIVHTGQKCQHFWEILKIATFYITRDEEFIQGSQKT